MDAAQTPDHARTVKEVRDLEQRGLLVLAEKSADPDAPPPVREHRYTIAPHQSLFAFEHPKWRTVNSEERQGRLLFEDLPKDVLFSMVHLYTKFLVVFGMPDEDWYGRRIGRNEVLTLVFEPDIAEFSRSIAGRDIERIAGDNVIFLVGEPSLLRASLLELIPPGACSYGYPAFFIDEGLYDAYRTAFSRVSTDLEIFYYRHAIEQFRGQDNQRGFPIRPLKRGLFYDRTKHVYENTVPAVTRGTIADLRNAFPGRTAILAAAGPALSEKLEWIRANADRAVVIAVNNSLRKLLDSGIEPHFTVMNDTSVAASASLTDLPAMRRCRLAAHFLSGTAAANFPAVHFFGNSPGQIFPERDDLRLCASVITTAFSLAEYLGCSRAILAGVQLSSPTPLHMNYLPGTDRGEKNKQFMDPGVRRYPYLAPVVTADGSRYFTNLNFLDAAVFLRDRIRESSLEVVNTEPKSIVHGDGIVIDPEPALSESPGIDEILAALPETPSPIKLDIVREYLLAELQQWKTVTTICKGILPIDSPAQFAEARKRIREFDDNGISYMLQRFEDFSNEDFHALYFNGPTDKEVRDGALYYFLYLQRMAATLFAILVDQIDKIKRLERRR